MGSIGYCLPNGWAEVAAALGLAKCDTSVAIRTITFENERASFSTGGGITIDSDPQSEFDEMMLKAKALLAALEARPPDGYS